MVDVLHCLRTDRRVYLYNSGSGKTHTIFGDSDPGVYEYVCKHIIENLRGRTLSICFVEIYGNRVYDLFQQRSRISLLEDRNGNARLVGQVEYTVSDLKQMMELIKLGMECRTTGTTEANAHSSRSHAIVQMTIKTATGQVESKFSLVDLAGPERGVDTGNIDKRARQEGSEINKSLLALKECIRALYLQRTNKDSGLHIPFRASKLTQILRDSFIGKNSQTSMIAMVSPGSLSAEHSLNTLRYADRVKEFKKSDSSKADSIRSPTEKQVTEPEFEPVDPVVEQFDDIEMLSKSLNSLDMVSMASSFSGLSDGDHESLHPSSDRSLMPSSLNQTHFPWSNPPLNSSMSPPPSNPNLLPPTVAKPKQPLAQFGFEVASQKVEVEELYDSVIQLHLETLAATTPLTRQERSLLANGDSEKLNYATKMLDILDQRLKSWSILRQQISNLHEAIRNKQNSNDEIY